jgi:hypothetical protein
MTRLWLAGFISGCTLAAQPPAGSGSIEGHVFNALSGEPLRKATVILTAAQIHLVDDTDSSGKFRFAGLPAGTYRLSANRPGFLERPARGLVSIGSNENVTDSEIRLPPQGTIAGHVLDEDNDPSPGATVSIFKQVFRDGRKQWERLNGSAANDAGEYRFPKLRPGRYLLRAYIQRMQPDNTYGDRPKAFYFPAYYPNAATQQDALPVDLGVGTEVRDIDIHLSKRATPPLFHVSGKVVGAPAGSTIGVALHGGDEFDCGGSVIGSPPDYAFDLTSGAGQCEISARVFSDGAEAYGNGSLTITGNVAGVVLAMAPAPTVSGRIKLAETGGQDKIQGVHVTLSDLLPIHMQVQEARSDAAGRLAFVKPIQPGHYSLIVDARTIPDGCFIRDVKLGEQEISPDDFDIQGSGQIELILSNTAAKIGGMVADADGNPVPISIVTLIRADGKSRPVKQSADDKGNFQFAGRPPGKYNLFAWEEVDDDLWQDPEFRKRYEGRSTEVTVGPGETQTVQLRIIPAEAMK